MYTCTIYAYSLAKIYFWILSDNVYVAMCILHRRFISSLFFSLLFYRSLFRHWTHFVKRYFRCGTNKWLFASRRTGRIREKSIRSRFSFCFLVGRIAAASDEPAGLTYLTRLLGAVPYLAPHVSTIACVLHTLFPSPSLRFLRAPLFYPLPYCSSIFRTRACVCVCACMGFAPSIDRRWPRFTCKEYRVVCGSVNNNRESRLIERYSMMRDDVTVERGKIFI